MNLLLLGTSGCHLCEQAEEIINTALCFESDIQIIAIDIAEHTQWQQNYATLIPVLLREESGQALSWPFAHNQVINFFETLTL